MKSICIKTTNQKTISYLLEKLKNFEFEDVYYSYKKFKIYDNIIIHFKGKNKKLFLKHVSVLLASLIIDLFEQNILKYLVKSEYFYFDTIEQKQIVNNTFDDLYNLEESIQKPADRLNILSDSFYTYLLSHHSIYLKGFITFRLKNYLEILLEQIDKSVNKYIIEKEYTEFISLLKIYIGSEPPACNLIHLIYSNNKPILLDEYKNLIDTNTDIFNAKYLSDISFSSNDYTLNTLLNLVPKKIYIHLIDNKADEFINTLKLIFEDRIIFCNDCSICKIYKKSPAIQS